MATEPKQISVIVKELERDLHDEERIFKDLERDIRRDADVLKQLEWDVAELGRAIPGAPARRRSRGTRATIAIVSGLVVLAAGFGIGMALQNVTTSNVRDDLAAVEAAQLAATAQAATIAASLDQMLTAAALSGVKHLPTSSIAFKEGDASVDAFIEELTGQGLTLSQARYVAAHMPTGGSP